MFNFCVSQIDNRHSFIVNCVSSMVNPKNNSIMFLTRKNINESIGMIKCENCLVFVPEDVGIDPECQKRHCIQLSSNPRLDYARLVNSLINANKSKSNYKLIRGSYFAENIQLGTNVVIEPLCLIDGDVEIGDNTIIKTGVKIRGKVKIGHNCIVRENTVIGTTGFSFVKDENGNNIRFPFLGGIRIGDNVEIGALCNIENAIADETIISDDVKLDSMTVVGHDVVIGEKSVVVAPKLAGHVIIGKNVFVGFNSTIKQRIIVDDDAQIGLGAVVVKNVPKGATVAGNPARVLKKD